MKIIAYHGSQTSKLKMYNDSALYFTTSYEQAKSYAKREWDEGLIEGEIPVVYKAELTFNNPYKIEKYDDFQMEFTDSNMNEYFREELIEKGYDSAIYNDRKSTLICIFYPSQYKILDIEKLPPSLDYYYNGELNDEDDDINDYYYENDYENELNEVLKLANKTEDNEFINEEWEDSNDDFWDLESGEYLDNTDVYPKEKLSDNFWNWFGNSKIKDEKGNPIIVYHSSNCDFNMFKRNPNDEDRIGGQVGYFFTNSLDAAEHWGDCGMIYDCFLKIENPIYLTGDDFTTLQSRNNKLLQAKANGYDGAVIKHTDIGLPHFTDEYIAFYARQIKLIDNQKFGNNRNITEAVNHLQSFAIPSSLPQENFKITNSLKDIKNWKARILENNSGGKKLKVGDYDEVGYVMISLEDNTVIPIARSDEHHRGYDIMYEIYESKYKIHPSNFYSVWCLPNSANYPYSKEEADKLKDALIKCDEYGMDMDTSKVYLKYIDSLYKNKSYDESLISARDFISGKYGLASFGETVSLIGEKLVDAFKNLSNAFENTNVRGDIPITQLKMAVKKLYTVGSRIQLPDKFKLINPLDLEEMMDIVEQYKSKYIDIQKLYKLFFGFNGFRNIFHQRLRKNIGNEDLNKQLGSVKVVIEMIGAI